MTAEEIENPEKGFGLVKNCPGQLEWTVWYSDFLKIMVRYFFLIGQIFLGLF